ncbi:hypothetical protein GCM10023350_12960 [Nocardioides endophyticus]|uniref:Sensor domain-containing protein n=1 Tax=Nocardioides endophyticus TaxID=1353775 RepID=A0ABP8YLC7_9ACTN
MSRRWLSRALVALAVPALVVPTLSSPAVAAKGAAVPSVAKVAKIYPYLAGGSATTSTTKVTRIGKDCKPGKPVKGATVTSATYSPADPAAATGTADAPSVFVAAMKFRSAKDAVSYLRESSKATKCSAAGIGDGVKVKVKKFKVKLGDQSVGYTVTVTFSGQSFTRQSVLARDGKYIVTAGASAVDGSVPDKKKAVSVARLAVKTAR